MSFYIDDCKTGAEAIARAKATREYFASLRPPPPPVVELPPPPPPAPSPVVKPVTLPPVKAPPVLASLPDIDSIPITAVIEATCQYLEITAEEILSHSRRKEIVFARHICIYIAVETTQLSMTRIARQMSGGDHSSMIHARDKVKDLLTKDGRTAEAVAKIMAALRAAYPDAKPPPERVPNRPKSIEDYPNSGKYYSAADIALLTRRWTKDGAIAPMIARELGRSLGSVFFHLKKLGLDKTSKPLTLVACRNPECGQEFQQRSAGHCYCSNACHRRARILRKKGQMA